MKRSNYTIDTAPGFICIIDADRGGRSVTNDAEHVIADLLKAGYDLAANRVIYRDSQGTWDEIVVRAGKFDGFRYLGAGDMHTAIYTSKLLRQVPL